MNSKKYDFHWENYNFAPTGKFACTTELLILGKTLLILSPFYLQMIVMQILTQPDNWKYTKSVAT